MAGKLTSSGLKKYGAARYQLERQARRAAEREYTAPNHRIPVLQYAVMACCNGGTQR